MIRIGTKTLTRLLTIWIDFVLAKARLVVALSILVTGLLFYYTLTHFSINTDTDRMIDPELDFRVHYAEFNAAFPQLADSFIIVIDGPTPEEAELAANHLLASLEARPGLFKNPYAPGLGAFWDQNGFLFLKIDELVALSDRLAEAQPVLSALADDTSLKSLFDVLVLATEDAAKDAEIPEGLPGVLDAMAGVSEAAGRGDKEYLSWVEMFDPKEGEDDEAGPGPRRRIIMVQPVPDFNRLQPAKPALLEARRLAREVQEASGGTLTVRITGKMALGTDELKSVSDGILLSGIVSLILVALVLGFGIRSIRLVAASLITLLSGLIWTAAFAIFAIGYLNIISVAFAVLFIGLGIDFAIHFSLRYREEVVKGKETLAALRETALRVGGPLSLAAPTTALAFYAFTPTAYAGLAQLGLISGTGMFISLFTSLTLLPALLAMMPLKHSGRLDAAKTEPKPSWIERHARPLALGGLAAGLFAAFFLGQVRFDEDPIRLKDPTSESVEAYLDLLEDSSSSPYAAQIVTSDAARLAELKIRLKALPEVDRLVDLASFVPKDQDEKLDLLLDVSAFMTPVLFAEPAAPTPVAEAGPAMAELIAGLGALAKAKPGTPIAQAAARLAAALIEGRQGGAGFLSELETALLRFFPATIEKLDAGLSAEGVALGDLPGGLLARYQTADGRQRLVVFPADDLADQSRLRHFVDRVSEVAPEATGRPVQITRSGAIVVGSMLQATSLAAILILGFLTLILRRFTDILFISVPVVLAALLTAAATVWLAIPFNFANVIVLPLLIGLGVDSGIHLVLRAREEHREAALLATSTPRAVLLSALTTIGSFGSLALSSHRGTASMGLLLTVAVALTLISALVVLPGLMAWKPGRSKAR